MSSELQFKLINTDPELFNKTAESIAKTFVKKDKNRIQGVSRTQLRKMYENVSAIKRETGEWENKLPKVKMIRSQVAYSVARAIANDKGLKEYYSKYRTFMDYSIKQINTEEEFKTLRLKGLLK